MLSDSFRFFLLWQVKRLNAKNLNKSVKRYFSRSSCKTCMSENSYQDILKNSLVQKFFHLIDKDPSITKNLDVLNKREFLDLIEKKRKLEKELNSLNSLATDGNQEMENLIIEEKKTFKKSMENIKLEIIQSLMSSSPENCNVEMQILPGIGGSEAKLFAEELFKMYLNYISYKNWDIIMAELKDVKNGYILVSGDGAHETLRHEAGVHRVQRVPVTEKSGRTHTSTCSISVCRKEELKEIVINDNDVTIERLRSSGPGGQNVNKLETCIRIKHIPTGLVAECQTSRYQYENQKYALAKLKQMLFDIRNKKITDEKLTLTKEQIGTSDYADKIRTYNFNQNRITDHRINVSVHNIPGFLLGGKDLDQMIERTKEFNLKAEMLKKVEKILSSSKI